MTFKILLSMRRVLNVGWRDAIFGQDFRLVKQQFRPELAMQTPEVPNGRSPKMRRGEPAIAREHRSPDMTVASTHPALNLL